MGVGGTRALAHLSSNFTNQLWGIPHDDEEPGNPMISHRMVPPSYSFINPMNTSISYTLHCSPLANKLAYKPQLYHVTLW